MKAALCRENREDAEVVAVGELARQAGVHAAAPLSARTAPARMIDRNGRQYAKGLDGRWPRAPQLGAQRTIEVPPLARTRACCNACVDPLRIYNGSGTSAGTRRLG